MTWKRNTSGLDKPKWHHTRTVVVRVPEVFRDDILAFAKKLDNGESPGDDDAKRLKQTLAMWGQNLAAGGDGKSSPGYTRNSCNELRRGVLNTAKELHLIDDDATLGR